MFPKVFLLLTIILAFNHQSPLITFGGKVAVIGSGAGGSSIAYFLSKLSPSTQITVFEKSEIIGGRAKDLELNLTICSPTACRAEIFRVELGASIIAQSNKLLMDAAIEFGLEDNDRVSAVDLPSLGIWDGQKFLVYHTDTWLSKAKLAWRYGYSLIKAPSICKELVKKFEWIYKHLDNRIPWQNHGDEIELLKVKDTLSINCKDYFLDRGVSEAYIDEFIGSIVRNIYLTDVDQLHAFACNVGLFASIDNMFQIKGGNKQLYEKMLTAANVALKSKVTSVERVSDGIEVKFQFEGKSFRGVFDQVVVATPETGKIDFKGPNWNAFPQFEFVKLYVTVVYGVVDPKYFGLDDISQVPANILTPKGHTPFNCFATTLVNNTHSVSKIFSKLPLSDKSLDDIFSLRIQTHTQSWDSPGSYPLLTPSSDWDLPVGQDKLYFVNSMERWVSTMETEVIAGKNIALNIIQSF